MMKPPDDDDLITREEIREILFGPWPEDEPRPTNGAELVAYWERHGLTYEDPDGYRVVLQNASWSE